MKATNVICIAILTTVAVAFAIYDTLNPPPSPRTLRCAPNETLLFASQQEEFVCVPFTRPQQ